MIVPLVVVLAIADDVHIMQHYDEERRHDRRRRARSWRPSRTWSRRCSARAPRPRSACCRWPRASVVAVREFGIGSAVGVMVDFVDLDRPGADPARLGEAAENGAAAAGDAGSLGPLLRVARFAVRAPGSRAGRRRSSIGRGRGARHAAAARRHESHQLLQRVASARPVGDGHRQPAGRHLQLPDVARRPAGLAEAARCAAAHGPARGGAAQVAARQEGHVGGRLRQARSTRS